MWNQIVKNINAFFNMPLVRNILTITYIAACIIVIISRTSIGRKVLNLLKKDYKKLVAEFEDFQRNKETQIADIKLEYENKAKELKKEYDNK